MSASRPEADTEYSRGRDASGAGSAPAGTGAAGSVRTGSAPLALALLGGGLLGALLLFVAEFTPLLHIQANARVTGIAPTIGTGSHHAYALIPLALLAAALTLAAHRRRARLALVSIGVLGLVALGIALLGDLPDAQASGLVGHAGGPYASAVASPGLGLYLETLGAIVLLVVSAGGLLLGGLPTPRTGGLRLRRSAS